jgi:hypothetical protein
LSDIAVLLYLDAPSKHHSLEGREHGRTIPLAVVEKARQEGGKELVALRASICLVRFQQRPDAEAKLAEFKALSWNDRDAAVRKLVTEEKLATMLGEDVPAPGAIDKCTDAIKGS